MSTRTSIIQVSALLEGDRRWLLAEYAAAYRSLGRGTTDE
jgi:hypothetical protein